MHQDPKRHRDFDKSEIRKFIQNVETTIIESTRGDFLTIEVAYDIYFLLAIELGILRQDYNEVVDVLSRKEMLLGRTTVKLDRNLDDGCVQIINIHHNPYMYESKYEANKIFDRLKKLCCKCVLPKKDVNYCSKCGHKY